MGDKRCYKRYYYINGGWLEDPPDLPKDYDLAIFICNKSEADILKNKVSDSIIKNIKDSDTISVFEDYIKDKHYNFEDYNYQYISLNIFNHDYQFLLLYISLNRFESLRNKLLNRIVNHEGKLYFIVDDKKDDKYIARLIELNISILAAGRISNIGIVIFEKEFYVFADDKLIADDIFIKWINRVVDKFKQDVNKFKQEKRVLGSVFIYYFLFDSMSDLDSILGKLDELIYYYPKKSERILSDHKILKLNDQEKIETNLMKNLTEIKNLIRELGIYLKYIKKVLRKIRPLFRETSEYYNKLSDKREECDDELYKIRQDIQSDISIALLSASNRQTKIITLLTTISVTSYLTSILTPIIMNFQNLENILIAILSTLIIYFILYFILKKIFKIY